jgi:alkylhydroperoxidase family enzyme
MPRLRPIEQEEAPVEAQRYYESDEERYGVALNNTKIYAYNVPVLRGAKALVGAFLETSAIPAAQKALIRLRVATLNGCPF